MNGFNYGSSSMDLGFGVGGDQNGKSEECYHCTSFPEKYSTLLTREQQPYCTKCFEQMFNGKPNDDDNNNKSAIFKTKPPPPPPKPKGKVPTIPFSTLPKPFTPSMTTSSISSLNGPQSPPPPPPPPVPSFSILNEDMPLPPPPPILILENSDNTITTLSRETPSPPPSSSSSTTSSLSNHTGASYENSNTSTNTNFSARSKTPSPNLYTTENSILASNTTNNTPSFMRKASPSPKSSSALAAEIISNSLLRKSPSPIDNTNSSSVIRKVPSPSSSTVEINNMGLRKTASPLLPSTINSSQGFKKPTTTTYTSSIQIPTNNKNGTETVGAATGTGSHHKYGGNNSYQAPVLKTNNVAAATTTIPKATSGAYKPVNNASNAASSSTSSSSLGETSRIGYNKQTSVDPQEETHLDQLNNIFKTTGLKKKQDDESNGNNQSTSKPPITAAKPTTFNCSKCKLNLLGRTVESKGGKIFCTPCYRIELANQLCVKCGQSFTPEDPLITYKHENWHSNCFKCAKCNSPIGSRTFCNQEKGLFCADCYFETSGRKCVKCKKYLKSAGFLFRNEPYHQSCFVCTGCNEPLGDNEILCKDNDPYCSQCFDQKYLEKCASCNKALIGESVEYEQKNYHDECFVCNNCSLPIGTTSFFPREGKIFCETCYTHKFGKTCNKCQQLIQPGLGLVYKTDQYYHKDCFTCSNPECNRSLSNISVHSTKTNGDPFCGDCFDLLFSKRCTACSNIISGVIGSRFISFQEKQFHVECFVCSICSTSLENRKFAPSAQGMICIACSKFSPYSQ